MRRILRTLVEQLVHPMTAVQRGIGVLVLTLLGFALSLPRFVPGWARLAEGGIMGCFLASLALVGLGLVPRVPAPEGHRRRRLAAKALVAILSIAWIAASCLVTTVVGVDWWPPHRVRSIPIPGTDRSIYVYSSGFMAMEAETNLTITTRGNPLVMRDLIHLRHWDADSVHGRTVPAGIEIIEGGGGSVTYSVEADAITYPACPEP